ncbi:MAG: hypothetical protein A4E61_01258 [Syntrophorhabdus sp. PtaB.Bin184]|nr:MAG: hypothetical protein A4E61_01258 [Syntrophorhabdus sp. PtaB.Bin184]
MILNLATHRASSSCVLDGASPGSAGLSIRLMDTRDALSVTRLFRKVYGFTYPIRYMYDPVRLSGMIAAGRIRSAVTVTGEERVVGHCALVDRRDGLAAIGMALVDPEYRHSEYNTRMVVLLANEACRGTFSGICSAVMTAQVYAQRAGRHVGFRRVALVVGRISAGRTYDGVSRGRRISVAYGYLRLEDHDEASIYPPRHHREFIEAILRNAGVKRRLSDPRAGASCPHDGDWSAIHVKATPGDDRATIEVHRYCTDTFTRVRRIMRALLARNVEQVVLLLPLSQALTAVATGEFERRGFFFAGVLPRCGIGDALVLQYLNGVSIDYDDILVASEDLAEIKAYVRQHDPGVNSEKHCRRS